MSRETKIIEARQVIRRKLLPIFGSMSEGFESLGNLPGWEVRDCMDDLDLALAEVNRLEDRVKDQTALNQRLMKETVRAAL